LRDFWKSYLLILLTFEIFVDFDKASPSVAAQKIVEDSINFPQTILIHGKKSKHSYFFFNRDCFMVKIQESKKRFVI
jgi:hypothetical protein